MRITKNNIIVFLSLCLFAAIAWGMYVNNQLNFLSAHDRMIAREVFIGAATK